MKFVTFILFIVIFFVQLTLSKLCNNELEDTHNFSNNSTTLEKQIPHSPPVVKTKKQMLTLLRSKYVRYQMKQINKEFSSAFARSINSFKVKLNDIFKVSLIIFKMLKNAAKWR